MSRILFTLTALAAAIAATAVVAGSLSSDQGQIVEKAPSPVVSAPLSETAHKCPRGYVHDKKGRCVGSRRGSY